MISKTRLVIATVLVFTVSCKGPTGEPSPSKAAEPAETTPPVEVPNRFEKYAGAALAIGHLLQADTPIWSEINAKYDVVKSQIAAIDLKHKTAYAKEIPGALNSIETGESIDINRHVVTKGLQHVTVLTISGLLDDLITADLESASPIAANIKTVFSAISPTFKRRDDTIYGGRPTLVPAAEQSLAEIESAKTKPALASAAMNFTTLLSKTYTLSVLFEMKGVEEFCGEATPDPKKCAIKRTEAGMYYRLIKQSVLGRDKEADSKIEKMISSKHGVPKYTAVRDLLANNLPFGVEDLTF